MKHFIFLSLLLLLTLTISAGDFSTGDFERDADNDPPITINYWDPTSVLSESVVETFIEFVDIDNTTSEMEVNITVNYGDVTFEYTMALDTVTQNALDNYPSYTFVYTLPAQQNGAYLQFFYTIYDGNTTIRSPLNPSLFYDAQWLTPFEDKPAILIHVGGDESINPILLIYFLLYPFLLSKYYNPKQRNKKVFRKVLFIGGLSFLVSYIFYLVIDPFFSDPNTKLLISAGIFMTSHIFTTVFFMFRTST